MSKPAEKEVTLNVDLPQRGFRKTLYFNRFRVDRDDGFCLLQVGLVVASDLVDSYSCVLSDETLKQNQKSLLEYSTKLGPLEAATTTWKGVTSSRETNVVDIVTMSRKGNISETAFYVFSMCAANRAASEGMTNALLPSEPLVLLRSTTDLQKGIITALYEGV